MDDRKLEEYLGKIGKGCFVAYFDKFADMTMPNKDLAALIWKERGYTPGSCRTRVSKARSIIKAERAEDTLRLIASSKHL